MWDFIVYLGESAISLAVLYLLYKATMSYETLHRLNRVVLLGVVVLAAVLPLCEIKIIEEVELLPLADVEGDVAMMSVVEDTSFDYVAWLKSLAVALFCLGAAFMVVRLVVSQLSVWRMTRSGARRELGEGVVLTVVDKLATPFSWFRNVVVAKSDAEQDLDLILEHELAHVRLHHSWDVLAVDIALCVWWFNPALWLLRRELQSLHEYQADDAVLRKGIDAKTYQILLIKRAVGSRLHSVANCLNHSKLQNRITMMCKKTSSRWAAAKALLVLPVVAISLSAFATTVYVPRDVQDKVTENSVNDKELKAATIEISGSKIYLNDNLISAEALDVVIEDYRLQTLIYNENDAESKRTYEAIHNTLKRNGNIDAIYANGKRPEISNVRIADGKIYLNDEQVTIEQLKAKADENPATLINLQADADTSMGMVADVKNAFRSTSHAVKVNYYKEDKPQPIYIVDGKTITNEDVNKIDPNTIKSVNVFKSYKDEFSKYGITEELAKNGVVVIELKKEGEVNAAQSETKSADIKVVGYSTREKDSAQQKDLAYIKVEQMPTFQGGDLNVFRNWMQSQIKYPAEAAAKNISGRVIFSFVVEKDGSTSEYTVLQSPDKSLADEVERIFKTSPKWEAGTQRGEKVRVKYTVPIVFNMQGTAENKPSAPFGNEPYIKVEQMPTFQGGDLNVFRNWMQSQIQYPAEAAAKNISGRVIFSFVVEKDGSTSEYTVLQSPDKSLADEVERIFKTCPKWEAGTQRGEKVRVKYTVPIVFNLQSDNTANNEFNMAITHIQKGDALSKEMNNKQYKDNAELQADQQKVNDSYKAAIPLLESAYAAAPNDKRTIQALVMITFRLRDEDGMMAKYEKYKKALEAL